MVIFGRKMTRRLMTMNKKHDIRIDRSLLHPQLDVKLGKLLDACKNKGIYLIITEGFRTVAQQDALYAKGRTAPGKIVTNAKGTSYSSQHQWGIAFDIAINDTKLLYDAATIKKVANLAKKIGLGWGGDWTSFKDTPHFYLKKWGSNTTKLKLLYKNPTNFRKKWKATVNKKNGLRLWKTKEKKNALLTIPNGSVIDVIYKKTVGPAKVRYMGNVGFVVKKYLK